jgi:hypothetical protein
MAESAVTDTKRIQFEFSPDAYERLKKLKRETDAQSYAELVRNALRVYEFVVKQEKAGRHLGIVEDGKLTREIEFLF